MRLSFSVEDPNKYGFMKIKVAIGLLSLKDLVNWKLPIWDNLQFRKIILLKYKAMISDGLSNLNLLGSSSLYGLKV